MRNRWPDAAGFSLLEALVASLLIGSAIVGLAHLVALGAEQSLGSRRAASAVAIAQSKLESLQRAPFRFEPDGTRTSSAALAASPSQSLTQDTPGFVESIDAFGLVVSPPGAAHVDYVRRWAVTPLVPGDQDTLLVQVCTFVARGPTARDTMPVACSSAVRTRTP